MHTSWWKVDHGFFIAFVITVRLKASLIFFIWIKRGKYYKEGEKDWFRKRVKETETQTNQRIRRKEKRDREKEPKRERARKIEKRDR